MRTRDADKELLVKQKAIELIGSEGLDRFSMNRLARACNLSVATLYIYYKDKDDLIIKIASEAGEKMGRELLSGFNPEANFEDGLRVQWQNRYRYMTENPSLHLFLEQVRSSAYYEQCMASFLANFKASVGKFVQNAVARGEIDKLPIEVYWSVAFSPLYTLLRFHNEGRSLAGKPFRITGKELWQTFDLVVKALKK